MQSNQSPAPRPTHDATSERLLALVNLRDRLQNLHAELEFIRLMLKLKLARREP